jgi:hypothetical protein
MGGSQGSHSHKSYGFDKHTAEKMLGDFRSHKQHTHKKRKKSFLDEIFD